jgi:hypothetical protein
MIGTMNDAGAKRKSLPATAQANPMAGRPACRGTTNDEKRSKKTEGKRKLEA